MTTSLHEAGLTGRPLLGVWSVLADPVAVEIAARSADYVCIDLQHGMAGSGDLPSLLQAARHGRAAALVRPAWNEPARIMRALDAGAAGVIVPMVDDADAAARAARAAHYPPRGERSWGPLWADVLGAPGPEQADAAVFCAVMIETRSGLDAVEQILAVDWVDGVYVGPNDLGLSCGLGRVALETSSALRELVDQVLAAGRAAGKPVGVHCASPATAREWAARGAGFCTALTDSTALAAGLSGLVEA